jgi:hypothetical protein
MSLHMPEAAGKFKRLNILDLEFRRHVRAVHRLGERALAELLVEIDADPHDIAGKLARYAEINPAALHAVGGHDFPRTIFPVPDPVRAGMASRDVILQRSLPPADGGGSAA